MNLLKTLRILVYFGALMNSNKNIHSIKATGFLELQILMWYKTNKWKVEHSVPMKRLTLKIEMHNWLSDSIKSRRSFPFIPWWSHPTVGSMFSFDVLFSFCSTCSCRAKGKLSRICKMNIGIFAMIHWATDLMIFNSKFTKLTFSSKHRLPHARCIPIPNGCIIKW